MLAKLVYQMDPLQERILEFQGYNKKAVINDGEMRDMYNMSSDEYPCLYQRKPRGLYKHGIEGLGNPSALLVKDKNGYLYPLGEQASIVLDVLRMELKRWNVNVLTESKAVRLVKDADTFILGIENGNEYIKQINRTFVL